MLPVDVLVIIASKLDQNPKQKINQGNSSRAAMSLVCKNLNSVLLNTPSCWEQGKWDVLYSMRRHHSFWCSRSMFVNAIRLFDLKLSDFMEGPNRLSCFAMEKGSNIDLFHVLIDDLGLTADHARRDNSCVLRAAASNNRVDVLMLLFDRLGMTANDARALDNEALIYAATRGSYNVLDVLLNTYGLTSNDVRAQGSQALTFTAQLGYTASLYLLIGKFGLSKLDRFMLGNPVDMPRGGVYEKIQFEHSSFCNRLLSVFNEELQRASSSSSSSARS